MHQMNLVPVKSKTGTATVENHEVDALEATVFIGSIERIVYFNEDTGQCVLDIKADDFDSHFLITGHLPNAYPGQNLEALVNLTSTQRSLLSTNGKIEDVLQAENLKTRLPTSGRTLKKFLKSEALSNIGPHLATLLAKAFPENFFQVLEQNSQLLTEVPGIGKKRQTQIMESWSEFKSRMKFGSFLFEHKLPLSWTMKLWPFYGTQSQSYLIEHPYQAAMKHNLDFEAIDAFGLRKGFQADSDERIRSGLYDILQTYYKQGHCAYPESRLLEEAQSRLNVPIEKLENSLELEILCENLASDAIGGVPCIYLKKIWELEQEVARKLLAFQQKEPPWGWFNSQKVLNWAQSLLQIQLAPLQLQAIETALSSSLTVITGGPGTGKTTLIRSLVTILQTQFMRFALCSPTGRAAQRLDEATGVPARTIHRLLKYDSSTGSFTYNRNHLLDLDLVLIDEVSMVDLSLMSHLLDALPERCALIFVGDADQIPPVGAGNILQSVIGSGRFNTVRLTDIFRQREKSLIKINAHRINSGEMPLTEAGESNDFHYIEVNGVEETKKVLLDLVTRVIPEQCKITDPGQFQILVPLNRGPLGTQQLNEDLQKFVSIETQDSASSSKGEAIERVDGFGQSFRKGDKVMVLKNDYGKDVFNGDIGFIHHISHSGQYLDVQFDLKNVRFNFDELDRLILAYAISIHKSQGSEYRAVIVVISSEHLPMAQRHLIYTAVTRGKEHVFLVAEPAALQTAIHSDENNRRWQKLTELLSTPPFQ